ALQSLPQFATKGAEYDGVEQRLLLATLRVVGGRDLLGEQRLIAERAGAEDLDHAVDVRIVEQKLESLVMEMFVAHRRHVDIAIRVADIGGRRQDFFQRRLRFAGERRHLDAGKSGKFV